jgi:hypothetical protein
VTVVKKKGFTGLKVAFGNNEEITFWHKDPSELTTIFEQFASIMKMENLTVLLAKPKSRRAK